MNRELEGEHGCYSLGMMENDGVGSLARIPHRPRARREVDIPATVHPGPAPTSSGSLAGTEALAGTRYTYPLHTKRDADRPARPSRS